MTQTLAPDKTKAISEQFDALFAPWNRTDAPGITVGVSKDGSVIYRRAFGMASLETFVANSPATRMRIGSTSKHFACLLALLLAEDGKLDIDAPIRTYIPELTGPGGDPTLRQLMQHRGGSRCYLDLGFLGHGVAVSPLGAVLAAQIRQKGRNFAPGETMIYNNGGYNLLSIAIERAGRAPFEAQLKERLFDPVGMADTASVPSDYTITSGMATMHVPLPNGGWRRGLIWTEEVRGEGAIVSTVDDMLRWTAHLRSRDRFGSPATWAALMELPIFPDGNVSIYALGLVINEYRGLRIIQHAGGVSGGSAQMLIFPDHGLDIVILINGAPAADPIKLAQQVADVVLADQLGEAAPTIPAADYQALLGNWWSSETEMIYGLIDDGGILQLSLCGSPVGQPLEHLPKGRVGCFPGGGIGEVDIDLEGANGNNLTIRFGGSSATYQKVSKETADATAFERAVTGQYHSEDGNSTAAIARVGERLIMTLADPYGRVQAFVNPLGETVAHIQPVNALIPLYAALTFTLDRGRATSFHLNTARTRNLLFTRSAPPSNGTGQ